LRSDLLATRAVLAAGRLRRGLGIGPADAMCPYDAAEQLGAAVRFWALPSLEAAYFNEYDLIVIGSDRPAGRRRYSCAHKLGHRSFAHGSHVHRVHERPAASAVEEYVADRFAAALLMPKLAVENAFARRGWSAGTIAPADLFVVSQELGVGYTTLVDHLAITLGSVTPGHAASLRRAPLPRTRATLAGYQRSGDVVVLDEHWSRPTFEVEVGDLLVVPNGTTTAGRALAPDPRSRHVRAVAPGTATLQLPSGLASVVRVARPAFTGLARYRYLEE
jgi:hypothetical protein